MKATDVITINGVDYVKCIIPPKLWKDCTTPCSFCHAEVQKKCPVTAGCRDGFCGDEHVCYIDFNDVNL